MVLALDDKGRQSLYAQDLTKPLAVVMGAEDRGVSAAARKLADQTAVIPMRGKISSLNVSVATGVILFEALRQRSSQDLK